MKGISLLLLDRSMEGITRKKLKTQGWRSSNTALLIFENVKVPAKNLLGKEHLVKILFFKIRDSYKLWKTLIMKGNENF